jgi:type III secretion system low calcium response chaperone LcrH/SycD
MDLPEEMRIPDEGIENLKTPEVIRKYIDQGKSLQEIIGYSDAVMDELYQSACTVFRTGHFQEAQDGFLFLTTLNPYVYAYWLGLAMSYQHLEEYEQAILAYECAIAIDQEQPVPYFFCGVCHQLLGEKSKALIHLEKGKMKCKAEHKDIQTKIDQTLHRLKGTS